MGTETTVVSTTVESEDLLYTIEGEEEDLIEADTTVEITTETTVVSTTVESEDLLYTIEAEEDSELIIGADKVAAVKKEAELTLAEVEQILEANTSVIAVETETTVTVEEEVKDLLDPELEVTIEAEVEEVVAIKGEVTIEAEVEEVVAIKG